MTIKGDDGAVVILQSPVVPFLLSGGDDTIDGLTITSDAPYPVEFIQLAGDGTNFLFSGNSWGIPQNAVDIALLAGTQSGAPYDPLSALEASNSGATISDQR